MEITRVIHIIQDDISNGIVNVGESCMMARAFKRELADLGKVNEVEIEYKAEESFVKIGSTDFVVKSACPLWEKNVELFDMVEPIEPFDCEVTLVSDD